MTSIPAPLELFGRDSAVDELRDRLLAGVRCLTVLGPPGIGKSTLIGAVLGPLTARYPGGVHRVDCDMAPDLPTIERTLGLGSESGGIPRRCRRLLVFDNAEPRLDDLGPSIAAWIAGDDAVQCLIGSRERVRLRSEEVFDLGALDESASLQVFLSVAGRLGNSIEVDSAEADAARTICEQLDHIPLAVTLAARQVRALSPSQIVARLGQPLSLLQSWDVDCPERHRSFAAALGKTVSRLTEAERQVFLAASTFAGGFTLEALEALVPREFDEPPVWHDLGRLRDRALVAASTDEEGPRYRLYRPIHAYASSEMRASEYAETWLNRQVKWARRQATHLAERVRATGQPESFARLNRERPNLRAAFDRALEVRDGAACLELAVGLDPVLAVRGPLDEHRALLEAALEVGADGPVVWRAQALAARGGVHRVLGELEQGIADLESARELLAAESKPGAQASVVAGLGIAVHERGDVDAAAGYHREALELARAARDRRAEGRALGSLAILDHEELRTDDAQIAYEQALAILREVGDIRSVGIFLTNLGELHREQGRSREAQQHYEEALTIIRGIRDPRVEAGILGNLGGVHHDANRLEAAGRRYEEAVALLRDVGDQRMEGIFTGYLGAVYLERGALGDALARLQRAVDLLRRAGDQRHEGVFWGHLGVAESYRERPEAAATAFQTAANLLQVVSSPLLDAALSLHRVHLDALKAGRSRKPGAAAAVRTDASQRVDAIRTARLDAQSDEVRFALRLLAQRELVDGSPSDSTEPPLRVASDGTAFTPPVGESADLSRRKSLRLLLQRLIAMRLSHPGQALSVDEMLAAGWPGDRVLPEAGANRVYVAVATLRKLGLRDVLVSREDGYLLDPEVPVEVK